MWDDLTIGYLAGLIDGEGYIGVSVNQVRVAVGSTDYDIIERAFEMSGIGTIVGPYLNKGRTKPNWRWEVHNRREIARLLCAISPLMCGRRRMRIMEATEYLSERVNRPKPCAVCGDLFRPSHWRGANMRAKYCSQKCNSAAHRQRKSVV